MGGRGGGGGSGAGKRLWAAFVLDCLRDAAAAHARSVGRREDGKRLRATAFWGPYIEVHTCGHEV